MTRRGAREESETTVVQVRAPGPQDEWETSWYRERLADPGLVNAGVVLVVHGMGYLAVPVGGTRRAGHLAVANAKVALLLADALRGREGFPAVRVRWSDSPETCHMITWGELPPETDDAARGRVFGYSEQAITAHLEEQTDRDA
ncbi:DUF6302 family protein [Streptomyces sp. CSDS2]|uniref:DUF6302 family protein n=1 Tax=Streptomyces sp. CSDS2 TaxID=3055051 RepID=UPI0025B1953F|nr:DUF6302 family protein [Streptomyces sp. CSDS2]MDN3265671.1 DUF6302 family protein [Streptomyces sp. CSDS2]